MIFAGIDIGSVSTKAVLLTGVAGGAGSGPGVGPGLVAVYKLGTGAVPGTGASLAAGASLAEGAALNAGIQPGGEICMDIRPTGWSPRTAGEELIGGMLARQGRRFEELDGLFVTGYGRISFNLGGEVATEIKCHARGVAALVPAARLIIDVGGQDSKVISVDELGRVRDFAMNDKCAAGTGKFLQVMANSMGLDVSELDALEEPSRSCQINSMCTVFAESEVIGMLASGAERSGIIAGLHQSVARRVAALAKRLGVREEVVFTGGVARNAGVARALSAELNVPLVVPGDCQFTGALGAALLARDKFGP